MPKILSGLKGPGGREAIFQGQSCKEKNEQVCGEPVLPLYRFASVASSPFIPEESPPPP